MRARFVKTCIYAAAFLATGLVNEAGAQSYVRSSPSKCDAVRAKVAQATWGKKYQAAGLPQSHSDCQADYVVDMADINVEMKKESDYISCLQNEIADIKNHSAAERLSNLENESEDVERLSKLIANAALRLRELRQNKPNLEQSAMAARKKCEAAVEALNKYRKPPPIAEKLDGTYLGEIVYSRILRSNDSKETLKLTITGSQVSGSTRYVSPSKAGISIVETAISGQVSSDGNITAAFTSKTHYRDGTIKVGYPGTLNGRISGQTASGSATFDRTALSQSPATGTWKAVRQ